MELKPGYKQTEVGVIPEDWDVASLESVALPNGLVRGPFGGALKKEYFVRDGYKVYEQRNAIYASADIGTYFIDEGKHRELIRFDIKPGDFIVSCSGTIGCIYRIPQGAPKGVINQALLKISLDDQIIDPYYFLMTFQSAAFQERIKENTHGGAMQNLVGMDIFRQAPLPLPTEPEQKAISTVIRDADALLDGLDRLIAKKRDLKQAAMQQLLTGKTRLPGFEGEWEYRSLIEIAEFQKSNFDDGDWVEAEHITDRGIRLIQTGNIGIGSFVEKEVRKYIYEESFIKLRCKELRVGDILICRLAEPAGRACIFPNIGEERVITSVDVTIFRPREEIADRRFIVQYCSTENWFKSVLDNVGGTTHKRISRGALGKLLIPFPSIKEQTAIATVLSDMDAEIAALEQRRNKTKDIKQAMMQELLTGKTRLVVPHEEEAAAC